MIKLIFSSLLLSTSVLIGNNPVDSWVNYNLFPDTIRIKDKSRAPDKNSYKWLKYIDKQSDDISLNKHIVENCNFYRAIIKKNTQQTNKTLKQYFRFAYKLFLSGICYCAGTGILYLIREEVSAQPDNVNLEKVPIFSLMAITGFCYGIGSYIIYKTIKQRLKLKKTLKRNAKMLHALEPIAK